MQNNRLKSGGYLQLRVSNQEVKILKDIVNETSMSDKAASIISEYTGIEKKKIQFFIKRRHQQDKRLLEQEICQFTAFWS